MLTDPRRAVGGIAFFVAGDEEGQGAGLLLDLTDGSDEGGDGALHVIGAAADQDPILYRRLEWVDAPILARWDDVEMACEAEMR
jgi:hypothetical protein